PSPVVASLHLVVLISAAADLAGGSRLLRRLLGRAPVDAARSPGRRRGCRMEALRPRGRPRPAGCRPFGATTGRRRRSARYLRHPAERRPARPPGRCTKKLFIHRFNPSGAAGPGLERVAEALRFAKDLLVPEPHDADGTRDTLIILDDIFGDPDI